MTRIKPGFTIPKGRSILGKNSPYHKRKQIFLPNFVIGLVRTPHLPPRYASFWVPLNFNKLDMRDYMKRVYGIDVLSVRSFIEQQKVTRRRRDGRLGFGPLRRPKSKKKMTIEMTEPFVWPDPPKDEEPWEKDEYFAVEKYNKEMQESFKPSAAMKAPEREREHYKQQAKDLLEGKITWKPTWQALGLQYDRAALRKFAIGKGLDANNKPSSSARS